MPGPIQRNLVVKFFGTPDVAEGSVNEPREREEHGFHFNERWVYRNPLRDPADATERIVYWHRYDYMGSMVRKNGDWQRDDGLPNALSRAA